MEETTYTVTEKGWQVAREVYVRYVEKGEDINVIAAEYGIDPQALGLFMAMAFDGGIITVPTND